MFIVDLIILLFSAVIHEVSHGYVAYRMGDNTAKLHGRLTLNPLKHLDPLGSVLLPLLLMTAGSRVLLAWAKPVPINESNFADPQKGMAICGLAGPLANFTIMYVAVVLLKIPAIAQPLGWLLMKIIMINFILGVFNLIPIPPLDGSRIVAYFLNGRTAYRYYQIEPYGPIIIFVLLYLGLFNYVFDLFLPILKFLI